MERETRITIELREFDNDVGLGGAVLHTFVSTRDPTLADKAFDAMTEGHLINLLEDVASGNCGPDALARRAADILQIFGPKMHQLAQGHYMTQSTPTNRYRRGFSTAAGEEVSKSS